MGVGNELQPIRRTKEFCSFALIRNRISGYKWIQPAIQDNGNISGSGSTRRPVGMRAEATPIEFR